MKNSRLGKSILKYLNKNHSRLTLEFIVRAFELPIEKTIKDWQRGKFSSADIALLKTLRVCPWLCFVADRRFDKAFSKTMLLRSATDIVCNQIFSGGDFK